MYIIGILIFFGLLIPTILLGGDLATFIDLPSIMIILFFTIPIIIGAGLFQDLKRSFKIVMVKKNTFSQEELEKSLLSVDLALKMIVISGAMGTILGIISILRNVDDNSQIGPSFSVALLTFFYALFCTVIFLPIKAKIKMFLIEIKNKSIQ